MIEHVYRRAAETPGVDAVVVATDDQRIVDAINAFGGVARLTQRTHRTGTDRVAEVAQDLTCEIVINLQGDLPLIEPDMIAEALQPFRTDDAVQMSTLRRAITDSADYSNPNVVKVVVDRIGNAMYFSRSPVPYLRQNGQAYKHIGLYAFRREFLQVFARLPETPLERAESLEQLRALEHGFQIRTIETKHETIEVDTPEDLERVRHHLAAASRA